MKTMRRSAAGAVGVAILLSMIPVAAVHADNGSNTSSNTTSNTASSDFRSSSSSSNSSMNNSGQDRWSRERGGVEDYRRDARRDQRGPREMMSERERIRIRIYND